MDKNLSICLCVCFREFGACARFSKVRLRSIQCIFEPFQQYTYLSFPVVLRSVTVPAEFGKVLTVVEGHLGFGGVLDLFERHRDGERALYSGLLRSSIQLVLGE